MPINDPNQGVPEQQGGDPANLPLAQVAWDGVMINRLWERYASIADRAARNAAPSENEVSALTDVDRAEIFNSAEWVSLYHRSLWANLRRIADSAAVNNSTVLVNDTNLVTALPTAGIFQWHQVSFYDCTAVADFKMAYTWPAGAAAIWGVTGLSPAAAANPGDGTFATVAASGGTAAVGGTGAGTILKVIIDGEITMGGTAGNLQFQYAQQNAEATNLFHRARSRMQVWRIS